VSFFFTADTHFNHKRIIEYCGYPFSNVEEMNETIITRWNLVVRKRDTVYHLGDFGWGNCREIAERLNGRIILIRGGHDHSRILRAYASRFSAIHDLLTLKIERQVVVLCHYCLRVWDRSHYNSWHLYGHSHGKLPPIGKSLDVGIGQHDFTPWSWEEIKSYMETRPNNFNYLGDQHLRK